MTSELQLVADAEAHSSAKGSQGTAEALARTSDLQGAGSDDGRTTAADVQFSDVLAMNLELQGAGGREGRITKKDLQAVSEVLPMTSDFQVAASAEVGDRMCYCDVCEGSWHEQPWLATVQCVSMDSELQGVLGNATPEVDPGRMERTL